MSVQVFVNGLVELRADTHIMLHTRSAQIQVTIAQADFFTVIVRHHQGQRLGSIQQFDLFCNQFNFAGGHGFIPLTLRPQTNFAFYTYTIFITKTFGIGKRITFRLDDDLNDTGIISETDKYQSTEIASAVYPATQRDRLTFEFFIDFTA